jgi:hypothetical protein
MWLVGLRALLERVEAHIAKMMRGVGGHNRIELAVHAVVHSLVTLPANCLTNSGMDAMTK